MDILTLDGLLPTKTLDFMRGVMPEGATFTRASAAWDFDASGNLVEYAENVPRFSYDLLTGQMLGLRLETAARTNLFLNNESPATQDITVTAAAHTISFYGTGQIQLSGAHTATLTGTSNTSLSTLTFTPSAGTLTCTVSGSTILPQVEVGQMATSRIITEGTPVTRAAESLTFPTAPWFKISEGTFTTEFYQIAFNGATPVICAFNGNINNYIQAYTGSSTSYIATSVRQGGGTAVIALKSSTVSLTGKNKSTHRYKTKASVSANGSDVATSAGDITLPSSLSTLVFGSNGGFNQNHYVIRSFRYWNRRLSDAEMARLSA